MLAFAFFAARRRAIRPAAAAPNSMTIGGAGTSVPPLEPPSPPFDPPLELEVDEEDDELVELDVDDDVLDDVEVLPPKLEDDDDVDVLTPPVDVETPPVDVETPPVEVETPPVDVEVETPPVDVETPPDVLEVLEPPVDVDELDPPDDVLEPPDETSISMLMPPLLELEPLDVFTFPLDELMLPPELFITPPDVDDMLPLDEMTTVPLLPPPPPPENPPKKPPPKPPPKPPEPPITTGTPPPPPPPSKGAAGMKGTGMGGMPWLATVTTVGVHVDAVVVVVRTTLRTRFTLRTGALCAISRALCFFLTTLWTCAGGVSATCIAPPPINAPPQVQAHNFAKAMRTDIISTFFSIGAGNGIWATDLCSRLLM